jgi:hypothetical protein
MVRPILRNARFVCSEKFRIMAVIDHLLSFLGWNNPTALQFLFRNDAGAMPFFRAQAEFRKCFFEGFSCGASGS